MRNSTAHWPARRAYEPSKKLLLPTGLFALAGREDSDGAVDAVVAGLDVHPSHAHAIDGVTERAAADPLDLAQRHMLQDRQLWTKLGEQPAVRAIDGDAVRAGAIDLAQDFRQRDEAAELVGPL